MDVKVIFLTVCLCALVITSTEAFIPKCCINTKKNIPRKVLQNVVRWEVQNSNGACDIDALRLYLKGWERPICAQLKMKRAVMRMERRKRNSRS